jgi:hypothetical protein
MRRSVTWTTTPPTEPGYYWLRECPGYKRVVVKLCTEDTPAARNVLTAFKCNDERGTPVSELPYAEWYGPLVPPE